MICYEYKAAGRRIWRGRIRLDGQRKAKDVSLQTRDHQVAKERLRKMREEMEREAEGLILPGTIREAAHKNITAHLADYVADLEKSGRSDAHVYHVDKRIQRLASECGWNLPKDMSADSFQAWRTRQRDKSPKTLNDFLSAASSFCKWLVRNGRMLDNALKLVSHVQERGHETFKRRAFSDDEMRRLLAVAGVRRPVYLTAVSTGLRRGELAALEWGDVDLDTEQPVLKVRACTTKNGRAALLPMGVTLTNTLRELRAPSWSAADIVFTDLMPTMDRMKKDMAAAGIIPTDARGQRGDFHALRHYAEYRIMPSAPRIAACSA